MKTKLLLLVVTIGLASASHAANIYVAMHNGATTSNAMTTRPAGILVDSATDTWNNPARNGSGAPNLGLGTSFTGFALVGVDGSASGATLDVSSGFTTFNSNGWGTGTQDHVMMEGWYGFSNAEFLTVNNLPADITANGYSVIIYGDANATNRDMTYTIGGQTVTILDRANFTVASGATFSEGDNFAVITGLSTNSFTIVGNDTTVNAGRSAINGFQIVANPIPEPSSAALLAIGFLLALRRRR